MYIICKCTYHSLKFFIQLDVVFGKKKTLGGNNRLSSNIPKWGNKLALDLIFTS